MSYCVSTKNGGELEFSFFSQKNNRIVKAPPIIIVAGESILVATMRGGNVTLWQTRTKVRGGGPQCFHAG